MSVLKRVEELYLDVLRFIIIAVASVLLIGAIVFAVLSASNFGSHANRDFRPNSAVNPGDVTASVLASRSGDKTDKAAAPREVGDNGGANDPNQALHERTARVIIDFVNKASHGTESLNKDSILEFSKRKANQFHDPATVREFAEGLATSMEKTLMDPKVLKLVTSHPVAAAPAAEQTTESTGVEPGASSLGESPIGIVNETLSSYTQLFSQKMQERERAKEQALAEELERKASATTQLYIAGAAFAAFLLLVFISIVVKIERNLRILTVATKVETMDSIYPI